jgi:hypothetical protein
MTSRIDDDAEFREAVCVWLRANGLNPNDIPAGACPSIADGQITVGTWVRGENGGLLMDPADPNYPLRRTVTVPLVEEPTGDVAEWLKPRCPTCGR